MIKYNLNTESLNIIKYLLIILIVLVHASPTTLNNIGGFNVLQIYFSQIIARVAVPLYFFFSGYLMSMGLNSFNDWKKKEKRRVSSLFMPYVIWNSLYGAFLFILSFYTDTSFTNTSNILEIFKLVYISPAISPLWFIRDLMIFQLISIFFIYLSRNLIYLLLIGLTVFWLITFHYFNSIISTEGLLFFTLGFYHYLPGFNFFKKKWKYAVVLAIILSISDVFIRYSNLNYSLIFHRLTVLMLSYSFIFLFVDSDIFKKVLNKFKRLQRFTFYIFVLHFPILSLLSVFLDSNNLIFYIIKIIITIVVCIFIGRILNKLPKLSKLLTGNRK